MKQDRDDCDPHHDAKHAVDDGYRAIEESLRVSARRIYAAGPAAASPSSILNLHVQRERRARVLRNSAAAMAASAVIVAAVMLVRAPSPGGDQFGSSLPVNGLRNRAEQSPRTLADDKFAPAETLVDPSEAAVAIPVFVSLGQWQGRPLVTPAIYVPPHARRIDRASLTDAERRAAERLLGLDGASAGDDLSNTL
jgi:hypothetical protein